MSFAQRLHRIKNYSNLEQIVFQQLSKQEPEPEERTNLGVSNLDNMQIFKVKQSLDDSRPNNEASLGSLIGHDSDVLDSSVSIQDQVFISVKVKKIQY